MTGTPQATILLEGALSLNDGVRLEVECLGQECRVEVVGRKGDIALPGVPKGLAGDLSPPASRLLNAANNVHAPKWGWMLGDDHCVVKQVLFRCQVEYDGDELRLRKRGDEISAALETWRDSFLEWLGLLTALRGIWIPPLPGGTEKQTLLLFDDGEIVKRARFAGTHWGTMYGLGGVGVTLMEQAMRKASEGKRLSAAHGFLLSTHYAMVKHDLRRAILDAGTAAELCLYPVLMAELGNQVGNAFTALKRNKETLGGLLALVRTHSSINKVIVPPITFSQLRNKVAHDGFSPSWAEACEVETAARRLVMAIDAV